MHIVSSRPQTKFYPPTYMPFQSKSHSKEDRKESKGVQRETPRAPHGLCVTPVYSGTRSGSASTANKSSTRTVSTLPPEMLSHGSPHEQCILILDSMDRKIRQMMKLSTFLMELVLNLNSSGIPIFDWKRQERIMGLQDRELQMKYKRLQGELTQLKKESLSKLVHLTIKDRRQQFKGHTSKTDGSQKTVQRANFLKLEELFQFTLQPTVCPLVQTEDKCIQVTGLGGIDSGIQTDGDDHRINRQRGQIENKPVGIREQQLKHRVNYMSTKAEGFKRRTVRLEEEMSELQREKDETDRINNQVASQILRLRAQSLDHKYRSTQMPHQPTENNLKIPEQ